ncbi:unnamed protein product [Nippostrongylus brasiliensis]|uniref:Transmembrane protein 144 (inferred by orthology to a human protein) n=1 Tax=Nippostrongylus brasiliensis TaxID=27835 RepID=A0A158R1U7_NIPBR|nr:unnamed protein product [Nippostrongylus brasiliensis]
MLVGLIAALSASVLFGSMFVPINGIPTGDELPGFSAQLFLCLGQFVVSTAFHLMLMAPSIQPIAMVSGINWALANSMAIPIMNRLGMALSVLVWSTVSCLIGWATSRFGMFGLPAAVPASLLLNYIGIIVLITGGVMYVFVKSNVKSQEIVEHTDKEKQAHLDQYPNSPKDFPPYLFSFFTGIMCTSAIIFVVYSFVKEITGKRNFIFLSIAYGFTFVGVTLITVSKELFLCLGAFFVSVVVHALQGFPPFYGFAMIGGILWAISNSFAIIIMNRLGMALAILVWNTLSCLTGWATARYGLFGVHAAIPASQFLNYTGIVVLIAGPEAVLPSLSAGVLFGLGMASFVVAIDHLNASIAYPICAMAPGLVVSMWSILYFREITGKRNLIVLAVAYCFTLVGVTLMTVSREVVFP